MKWSTRAPRGRQTRKTTRSPNIWSSSGHSPQCQKKTRKKRRQAHFATQIAKTISRTDGCGLVKPSNSIRTHGSLEIHRKELRRQQPNCTNMCENESDQQRALVDRLPNARLRARCASLRRGNDSRPHLQGGWSETSTQCQGRRNRNGSVTLYGDAATKGL